MCTEPLRYRHPARSIRFSKKGEFLAVGTQGGEVHIYAFEKGTARKRPSLTLLRTIKIDLPSSIEKTSYAHSFKRKRILDTLEKTPSNRRHVERLRQLATRNPEDFLKLDDCLRRRTFVLSLDFSPDGKVLAVATDIGAFSLYEVETGTHLGFEDTLGVIQNPWHRVSSIKFCGEKHRLYVANGKWVHALSFR